MNIFSDFNFEQLNSPDFKEDSVREVLILPLLQALGYTEAHIVRSKSLQHPFLKIGSKKRPITLIPDYLLKIDDSYAWVLDAKAPTQNIKHGDNVEQVYSYSIHPEVRTKYFALCNGRAFALFHHDSNNEPFIYFELTDIAAYWESLIEHLAVDAFHSGKTFNYPTVKKSVKPTVFDYLNRPLLEEIPVKKQSAKRHFGVHGYFTKQAWNVVQAYIKHFSQPGDLVLDPFGGSGITAIEAMMTDRKAIHLDLNPLSVFLVDSISCPVIISEVEASFERIKTAYLANEPTTEQQIQRALKKYPYPKDFVLPKGSDVAVIQDLFSKQQLAQLAFLKFLILKERDKNIKKLLMLAFSGLITKINLTTHYPKDKKGGADAAAFKYYRYRIAHDPANFDVILTYAVRIKKIINAKREIEYKINIDTIKNLQILQKSATDLFFLRNETVDYIYTDPPYSKKIPYLDLSIMWNAWLDLTVTEEDYQLEAIEGGEHQKSKQEYNDLISKSIQEMYRVLKFDRWMSFVFAHKDPEFWHLIVETAERCGFEYVGAVSQKNGHKSFKKIQNPFTVLSGQLIINFKKVRRPKHILRANLGIDIGDIVMQTIEGVIATNNGATLEQINDELIIKGLELGFLDLMKKSYSDLTPLLLESFDYDAKTELFTIKPNRLFKTHVDINLRVRYYLISYLRRLEREKKPAHFDAIVLHIMPLLKNGVTPENQTILNILEDIADKIGDDGWKLKTPGQQNIF